MPQIIETTVYQFDELVPAAKERARSWYRETCPPDDWFDFVFDDFAAICALLGIELKSRAIRLFGESSRQSPRIWFTGFSSQGDGACFEGWYRYAAGAGVRVRQYAPLDTALHAIADRLQAVQRRNFYELVAETTHHGRYYHEYAMAVGVDRRNAAGQGPSRDAEEFLAEALRDLARWLYHQLEREHDHC
ncbi:MAG: antitoxin of toxin-antitoxin stability system [Bradyrhizobium sp.]|nr:antitoxin of toxin-antitoxin stability system [Bradyrhizobium sp.]